MNEQATLSNPSDEEVTLLRCSKDRNRPSRISSDDDQELEHAGPPMDNVDNTSEEEVTVKRRWKGRGKCVSRVFSDDDDQELEHADPLKDKVDSGWDQKNQSSPSEEALTRCSKDSARKRTVTISSDDDDDEDLEDADADNATPSLALRKRNERRKGSCEKFRRQLKLDKYKAKREESQAKKRLRLSGHESDINDQCHSLLHESMNEKDFPSAEAEDDSTFEESPGAISGEEDLSTPNSEDGSSEDSDSSLEGFIVRDSECSSQNMDLQENAGISDLQFSWNPTRKEAFEVFLQSLLTKLLLDEDPSYGFLERIMKENPHLADAERKVEDDLQSRKSLVSSSRWDPKFTDELKNNSVLTHKKLPHAFEGKCQACRCLRDITRKISLQNDNEETVVKFRVGQFCADRAVIYQKIHHFCDVKLGKSCLAKIPDLKEVALADRDRPVIESVRDYCKRQEQQEWINELFDDYEELLNDADKWAIDGSEYKRMKTTVFSYRA